MNPSTTMAGYELYFRSLFDAGRGFAFPCDEEGRIALDTMSERGRASYLRVRTLIGVELAAPVILRLAESDPEL